MADEDAGQWHYARDGKPEGPVSLEYLRAALASGALKPEDLVWQPGMANWIPASSVPELQAGGFAAPAPYPDAAVAQPWAGGPHPGLAPLEYRPAPTFIYAGFWLRFVAALIDWAVLMAISFTVGTILGVILRVGAAGDMEQVLNLIGLIIGWLYAAGLESSARQATLGKMAVGLVVTDEAGNRISFARATGRHFAKWISVIILFIGFIMVAFTAKKQGLHDIIAGCLVVRK